MGTKQPTSQRSLLWDHVEAGAAGTRRAPTRQNNPKQTLSLWRATSPHISNDLNQF